MNDAPVHRQPSEAEAMLRLRGAETGDGGPAGKIEAKSDSRHGDSEGIGATVTVVDGGCHDPSHGVHKDCIVGVLSMDGKPLGPTRPAKAKHWLKSGKAKLANVRPFVVQLTVPAGSRVTMPVSGVDSGSVHQGMAVTNIETKKTL